MNDSLRQLWFCTIPLGAGVIFFHELLLKIICLGGQYSMSDLDAARQVAIFYGCGIPFFCALKIILPAFFARKDMKTPLYASLTAIVSNAILSIALSRVLEQGGIALATAISSAIHCTLLAVFLKKAGIGIDFRNTGLTLVRSLLASAVAGVGINMLLERFYHGSGRLADIIALSAVCASFGIVYLVCSFVTGSREISEVIKRFRKKSA
jgi:putative peptidoglycan lipid II flippase